MTDRRRVPEDALSRIHVPTSRTKMAFERLDDFMSGAREMDSNRSLVVIGDPGTGKTHLIKRWLAEEQSRDKGFRGQLSEVPAGSNVMSVAARILKDLGDPDPEYGQINSRTSRIVAYAKELDVIVIDEMQRLVEGKTALAQGAVATWITSLLNEKEGCPIILAGELSALEVFLPSSKFGNKEYMDRRTLGSVEIKPWDWNSRTDQTEYRAFLHTMDGKTGLELSGLSTLGTALRCCIHSKGRPGQTVRLISEGRTIARRLGRPLLSDDILAEAVDRLSFGKTKNPFRIESIETLEELADSLSKGETVRHHGKKPRVTK
jgi:hypothetical protein